jgi:hypothetical protein
VYNVDAHARIHTHPYEHKYANHTPMSTSEELGHTFGDSRSHLLRLVIDGYVAYDLKHNAGK